MNLGGVVCDVRAGDSPRRSAALARARDWVVAWGGRLKQQKTDKDCALRLHVAACVAAAGGMVIKAPNKNKQKAKSCKAEKRKRAEEEQE